VKHGGVWQLQLPVTTMHHPLYEPPPTMILYVGPCYLMLSRVPLILLFLQGNTTPTIPYKLRHLKGSAFQFGTADTAAADGSRGSNVYEVNPWL